MVLVGASLGGATAVDFALNHPEAVSKLILIDGQAWAEGLGPMASLPRWAALLGVQASLHLQYPCKPIHQSSEALELLSSLVVNAHHHSSIFVSN